MKKSLSILGCMGLASLPLNNAFSDNQDLLLRIDHLEKQLLNSRPTFNISGTVEMEVSALNTPEQDSNDANLATIEIALDTQINTWADAHILLLHEEGEDQEVVIEEGIITLTYPQFPLILTTGKQAVAFGSFKSHLISDPLTLELAETKDTAITLSSEQGGFYLSTYAFNGDINKTGSKDKVNQYGAALGYAFENESLSLSMGLDYLSNLSESEALLAHLDDSNITHIESDIPAIALHTSLIAGNWHLLAEYVSALDSYQTAELDFNGLGARPRAFSSELAYNFNLAANALTITLGLQGSDRALALDLPKQRILASTSWLLQENTALGFELMQEKDYAAKDGGSNKTTDTATLQLAVVF